jgi:hypothetical protein
MRKKVPKLQRSDLLVWNGHVDTIVQQLPGRSYYLPASNAGNEAFIVLSSRVNDSWNYDESRFKIEILADGKVRTWSNIPHSDLYGKFDIYREMIKIWSVEDGKHLL